MGNSPVQQPPPGENLWHNLLHSDARSGVRAWLDPVTAIALRCTSTLDLSDPHPDTWVIPLLIAKLEHRIWHLLVSRTWYGLKTMDDSIRFQIVCWYYGHTTICTRMVDKIAAYHAALEQPTWFGGAPTPTHWIGWWAGYGFMIAVAFRHDQIVRHCMERMWRYMVQVDEFLVVVGHAAIVKALSGIEYADTLHALLENGAMAMAVINAHKRKRYGNYAKDELVYWWLTWQRSFVATVKLDKKQLIWSRHCWYSMCPGIH